VRCFDYSANFARLTESLACR